MFDRLPAPAASVFNGGILQYSDSKVAFAGLLGQLLLKPSQRFYYLKQYLKGKALSAVSSFFLIHTAAFGLVDMLEQIGGKCENTMLKLSTMTSKNDMINSYVYSYLQIEGYSRKRAIDITAVYSQDYIMVTGLHTPSYHNVKHIHHLKQVASFMPSNRIVDLYF